MFNSNPFRDGKSKWLEGTDIKKLSFDEVEKEVKPEESEKSRAEYFNKMKSRMGSKFKKT